MIVILYLFQSFELWKRCAQLQVETSSEITVGSNTQPWGNDKHQDTGDFVINSGTTVNMEAGTSIKLQSGFKLCNGANFKASVDGSSPMLKSSFTEQIKPPIIVGNKYASVNKKYSTNVNATENVSWLLLCNNTSYGTHENEFCLPNGLENGQYTLICEIEKNGQKVATSRIIIVQNAVDSQLEGDLCSIKNSFILYPNPAKEKVSVKLNNIEGDLTLVLKNIEGGVVATYTNISALNSEIDLTSLSQGIYFVDLVNHGVVIGTKKLIKQ